MEVERFEIYYKVEEVRFFFQLDVENGMMILVFDVVIFFFIFGG